jgi:hypothetical protein
MKSNPWHIQHQLASQLGTVTAASSDLQPTTSALKKCALLA